MRSTSPAKRKSIRRDFSKNNTLMQDGHSGYGNIELPPYYSAAHPLFDNIALWGGFGNRWAGGNPADVDNSGWPVNDQWQVIYGCDMIGQSGDWEPALFADHEYGGLMVGRYKTRAQWDKAAIAWHPDFGTSGRIIKDVTLEDGYTHEFVYEISSIIDPMTGLRRRRYVGFVGKNGIGLTDLQLPRLGLTFEDISTHYFASDVLSYYKRYKGLRLMEFALVNNYAYDVSVLPQNVMRFGIPEMVQDFHPNSKYVKGGWGYTTTYVDTATNLKVQDTIGIPFDLQVQFLNELYELPGSMFEEAYVHIPIQATNETMELIFRVFAKHLNPNIKVYFELGNEVWNFSFKASNYALNKAQDYLDTPEWNLSYNGDRDLNNIRQKFLAAKATDMMLIAQRVWREAGKSYVPKGVLAGMYVTPGYAEVQCRMVEFRSRKKASELFKAIAIAPYFGPSPIGFSPSFKGQNQNGKTKEEYLHIFRQAYLDYHDWFYPAEKGGIKYFKGLAATFGVELWVYEAGYDYSTMTTNNGYDTIAITEALLDPEMADIIYDFQRDAYRAGIDKLFWYRVTAGTWYRGGWNSWFQFHIQDGPHTPLTGIHKAYIQSVNSSKPSPEDMLAHNKVSELGGTAKYAIRTSTNLDFWRKNGDDFVLNSTTGVWFPDDPVFRRIPEEATDRGEWNGNYLNANFFRSNSISIDAPARWVMFPVYASHAGLYSMTLWGGGGAFLKGKVHNIIKPHNSKTISTTMVDAPITIDVARVIPKLDKESCMGLRLDVLHSAPYLDTNKTPSYLGTKVGECDPPVGTPTAIGASLTPVLMNLVQGWNNITISGRSIPTSEDLVVETYSSTVFWLKAADGQYYLSDRDFNIIDNTPYADVAMLPADTREQLYPWTVLNMFSYDGNSIGRRISVPYPNFALSGIADFSRFEVDLPVDAPANAVTASGYVRTNSLGEILHAVIVEKGCGYSPSIDMVAGKVFNADGTTTPNAVSFWMDTDRGAPLKKGDGRLEIVYEYDALGRLIFNEDGTKKVKTKRKISPGAGIQRLEFVKV